MRGLTLNPYFLIDFIEGIASIETLLMLLLLAGLLVSVLFVLNSDRTRCSTVYHISLEDFIFHQDIHNIVDHKLAASI